METCLENVRLWMTHNKLKLNDSKTELLIICKKPELVKDIAINIGNSTIKPSKSVRNLGAVIDDQLSMKAHINNTTRNVYYHLRRIARIRAQLTSDSCAKVINATVTSRLDFHNGLLLGLPTTSKRKLQVAQNNAARLLTRTSRREHITPVLKQIHWLPVDKRTEFKVLTLMFQGIHCDKSTGYLKSLCPIYTPRRSLRSENDTLKLCISRFKNSYGSRSISTLGANLWNNLPFNLRNSSSINVFKKSLKTFLFNSYFNS
eukprot:GHVO01051367.1.p1 GENE.GHVO01051367.1~~GHVO01051367.1.p1  ORF type:complete len:260 (+),score=-2.05 GHVO01051367.1:448-1227(+)